VVIRSRHSKPLQMVSTSWAPRIIKQEQARVRIRLAGEKERMNKEQVNQSEPPLFIALGPRKQG
jgi:hypothetical protein